MAQSLQGISALDPRVAATDKFIQEKQIPPDQVEDFLLGMGADPRLASLVFKYRKVKEAAEKQQNEKPSTSNVADEVSNQYAQLKQQERMRQGVAGMPTPNLARAAMRGGITGEPAPQAQMAGGGIVAFGQGGRTFTVDPEGNVDIGSAGALIPYEEPVKPSRAAGIRSALSRGVGAAARFPIKHPFITAGLAGAAYLLGGDDEEKPKQEAKVEQAGLSDEQRALLAGYDKENPLRTPSDMDMPGAPKFIAPDTKVLTGAIEEYRKGLPKTREEAIQQQQALEDQIGETKAIKARRDKLEQQLEKSNVPQEKRFWLAFAQAGFAASAKGARNLWETLSVGGAEGMKAYQTMKEKEEQTRERLEDKLLQLDSMESAVKRGVITRADSEYKQAKKDVLDLKIKLQDQNNVLADSRNRFNLGVYGTNVQAAIAKMGRAEKKQFEDLQRQYARDARMAMTTQDSKLRAALEARSQETLSALSNLAKTDPSVIRAMVVQQLEQEFVRRGAQGGAQGGANSSGGETYLGSM